MEREYFTLLKDEIYRKGHTAKLNCDKCQRECSQSPEETSDCLANLMTIEFLLDHC